MSNPDLALAESVSTTNASYFIFVYIVILIYCCVGLAVVCDVYFVPALQQLSYTYDLPPDIAGSTLMALGASVPELFASLVGVFITEDDIGTGSIIGSSCFNLIAVPAACAFVAATTSTRKLSFSSMPVIRNSAYYAVTILVLLLIIKDNKVDILEAIILLLFFVMYMALMIFSAQTGNCSDSLQSSLTRSYIRSTDSALAEHSPLLPYKSKKTFKTILTFLASIVLIGGLTYLSVRVVHLFGQSVGIPETVAGMTILSWGTGIPELIASIVLIKKTAQADMAICNTIGSNVIDVSFCLSLPWLVKCLMNKAAGLEAEVYIQSSALPWTSFTLFLSVLLLVLVFKLHNWTLSFSVGVWLTLVYVMFVVAATYLESSFSESGLDLMSFF